MATRATLNISLPSTLRDWVESLVPDAGYGTVSEYIRELVREDQKRRTAQGRDRVDRLLREALAEDSTPMSEDDWRAIRQTVRDRLARRGGGNAA